VNARGARAAVAAAAIVWGVAPRTLGAQDTSRAQPPVPADSTPALPRTLPVNGLLLRAQHLRYEMNVVSADSTHVVGFRDVDLRQSTYGAFPAWLLVETRGGPVPTVDSLYLSYVDLRPLHWSAQIGRAHMALEFTADSVYGATTSPAGNQNIVRGHGHDLLAGDGMTAAVLQLMPHAVGRVDSVSVLTVDLGSAQILPGALSVDGEQDIDTPAGRRHCWVMSLSTPAGTVRYWVSEANPVVVQSRQVLPGRPGVDFLQTLISRR
jgi:hypothetical protein